MVGKPGRPEEQPDTAEMQEVARLFYSEDITRQEISKRLHIDPRKVSWLLEQARALGVVRIDIRAPLENDIAGRLQRKFPRLERVFVVRGSPLVTGGQRREFFRRAGTVAADYFDELIAQGGRRQVINIGVSGGEPTFQFANAIRLRARDEVKVQVTALIGRNRLQTENVDPCTVATVLWNQCGSIHHHFDYMSVEPYWFELLDREDDVSQQRAHIASELGRLERLRDVRTIIERMNHLHVVFGAFGSVRARHQHPETEIVETMSEFISPEFGHALAEEGVIADFCYCPFDSNGRTDKRWKLFLTAGHYSENRGIDFYKHMVASGKKVVGFGGPGLFGAINAALKAEIVNVLIIDEFTARQIADEI